MSNPESFGEELRGFPLEDSWENLDPQQLMHNFSTRFDLACDYLFTEQSPVQVDYYNPHSDDRGSVVFFHTTEPGGAERTEIDLIEEGETVYAVQFTANGDMKISTWPDEKRITLDDCVSLIDRLSFSCSESLGEYESDALEVMRLKIKSEQKEVGRRVYRNQKKALKADLPMLNAEIMNRSDRLVEYLEDEFLIDRIRLTVSQTVSTDRVNPEIPTTTSTNVRIDGPYGKNLPIVKLFECKKSETGQFSLETNCSAGPIDLDESTADKLRPYALQITDRLEDAVVAKTFSDLVD